MMQNAAMAGYGAVPGMYGVNNQALQNYGFLSNAADVANNPTVFLSSADLARMVPPDSINNDLRRLMTRTFTSFKTGL
jgi:hypothetical protein